MSHEQGSAAAAYLSSVIEERIGPPWPAIRCNRCGHSRHFWTPRDDEEQIAIEMSMDGFTIEHAECIRAAGTL